MRLRRVQRTRWEVLAVCDARGNCLLLDFLAGLEARLDRARASFAAYRAAKKDGTLQVED